MKYHYKYLLILLVSLVGIIFFTRINYNSGKRLEKTNYRVNHTNQVIRNISQISITVSEIQSDFLGWLSVDKDYFAVEINKKSGKLAKLLEDARALALDDNSQQENILGIKYLADHWLIWQQTFTNSNSNSGIASPSPTLKSKLFVDSIKHQLAVISIKEEKFLQQTILENKEVSDNRMVVTVVIAVSYLVFVVLVVLQLRKNASRRKRYELSLLNSEIKYRRLIEDAGVVMFTTTIKGDFDFVNHKMESFTGYKETEILHKSFKMIVAPGFIPMVDEHYRNQRENKLREASIEFQIITKSGEEKWIEQDSVLIYENKEIIGYQCIARDINRRKKAEADLLTIEIERKEYEYRLQSILDNTPLLIFVKDLEGKYMLANKQFKLAFNSDKSLIGKTDYDFDSRENADRFKEADEIVYQTLQPLEREESINHQGKIQNLMVVKFPLLDQGGKIFAICGIATDITERVQYHKYLLETRKNAETAEKLQGEFLANMSHEIRTPMNGIIGMTNLLLQTPLDPEQKNFLQIIRQSSDNLLFLINDILDLSKIKAGKMTIESIEFNIASVIETVIAPFRIKLKEKGVELITDISPDIPEMLIGDPYRLSQILSNLFGNAIKFTSKGYIKFMVLFTPDKANCTLRFSVEDTGIGISEDKIQYIFESFSQADKDTTRKFGGTGLGLSITRQLIELQNGSIEVSSIVNRGTTFRFLIPYKMVPTNMIRTVNEKQVDYKDALKGKRILIVEDNEINQQVISFTLKQAGILTTILNNGKEAVDLLESGTGNNFDLIIMDLQMPVMNGFEASSYIRKDLKLQTPIIAMTANVLRDERIRCFQCGMNEYMSKPFKPADLFNTISRLLHENTSDPLPENPGQSSGLSETAYDFNGLYNMMPKLQASEVIGLFVNNTPALLNKIQTAVLLGSWDEVANLARLFKSSIELLQLHEMLPDIVDLERMSRLNIQLENMPSLVNRLIDNFNAIKPILEEEKNLLAIS